MIRGICFEHPLSREKNNIFLDMIQDQEISPVNLAYNSKATQAPFLCILPIFGKELSYAKNNR